MMTFTESLSHGQGFENIVLTWVQRKYPEATLKEGSFKPFDIDLGIPEAKVECKFDIKSQQTANIAVECFDRKSPSGLTTTEATIWVHGFWDDEWKVAIGPTDVWRKLCLGKKVVPGGDEGTTYMYLVPKSLLYETEGIHIRLLDKLNNAD